MMHTLCKYSDETELVISDIITRDNGDEIIKVVFERPTKHGFDTLIVEQGVAHFFEIAREGELESA